MFFLIRFFFSFFFFWLFLYFIMSDSLGQLLKAHHQKKQEIKRNNGISCNFHRLVLTLLKQNKFERMRSRQRLT